MLGMFGEIIENVTDTTCQKVAKKSSKAVKEEIKQQVEETKKEVKEKVDKATTGENGKKLLIAAVVMSGLALLVGIFGKSNKPVIVNVYNK